MVKRLEGKRTASPAMEPTVAAPRRDQIILGVDPSLRCTGFGVIRTRGAKLEVVAYGEVPCPASWPQSRCLLHISQTLRETIAKHRPTVCVVEGIFYAQNLQTAILMGAARGASLVSAAEAGLDVYEIAAKRVKQAIVGFGGAGKPAVAKMVQRMLGLAEEPPADAADALALAIAHAQEGTRFGLVTPRKV